MHSLAAAPLQPAQSREDGWQGAEPCVHRLRAAHARQPARTACNTPNSQASLSDACPTAKKRMRKTSTPDFVPRCSSAAALSQPPARHAMPTPPPRRQHRSTQPASALRHSLRLVAGAQVHTPAKGEGRELAAALLDAQAQAKLRALERDGLRIVIL